jgi:hypothetical protein
VCVCMYVCMYIHVGFSYHPPPPHTHTKQALGDLLTSWSHHPPINHLPIHTHTHTHTGLTATLQALSLGAHVLLLEKQPSLGMCLCVCVCMYMCIGERSDLCIYIYMCVCICVYVCGYITFILKFNLNHMLGGNSAKATSGINGAETSYQKVCVCVCDGGRSGGAVLFT